MNHDHSQSVSHIGTNNVPKKWGPKDTGSQYKKQQLESDMDIAIPAS